MKEWHLYQHARKRARERYDLDLNFDAWRWLNKFISENYQDLERVEDIYHREGSTQKGKNVWRNYRVKINGKEVIAGYHKRAGVVKTFLFESPPSPKERS